MCQRNIQCIQYKNCVYFHCLPPYFKDSREMQGEQILWGLRCLFFTRACQVDHLCSWLCSNFPCFKPLLLRKCASSLRLRLFYCLSFFILSHGFERRRTCSYCYLSVPFFTFFLTQFFTPFYNCAFLFTAYSFFSFIPIFTRTSFIVLNFILLRASLDATISLFVSVFIRLNLAQRQASYHSYTSLLPLFIYHAYFVQCRMVSS